MPENAKGDGPANLRQLTLEEGLAAVRTAAVADLQTIADGKVPEGYIAQAQPYQGRVRLVIALKEHAASLGLVTED